jgi:hypothetical protein
MAGRVETVGFEAINKTHSSRPRRHQWDGGEIGYFCDERVRSTLTQHATQREIMSFDKEFARLIAHGNAFGEHLHPEDRRVQEEALAKAKACAPAFAEEHRDKLVQLIAVYSDVDAREALEMLREEFWAFEQPGETPRGLE